MLEVQYNNTEVLAALAKLQKATGNLSPALKEIGEVLSERLRGQDLGSGLARLSARLSKT